MSKVFDPLIKNIQKSIKKASYRSIATDKMLFVLGEMSRKRKLNLLFLRRDLKISRNHRFKCEM